MRTRGLTNPIPVREEILAEGRPTSRIIARRVMVMMVVGTPRWAVVSCYVTRHLPGLTADELERMEELNPRSSVEIREEIKEEEFLKGANE
jgi:hypothetical protein